MTVIATTKCDGVSGKGERVAFELSLESPHQIDDVSWGCAVTAQGLIGKPHTAVGADSWQSLTLAIGLIEQLLTYFVEDGGKLFFKDSASPMEIQDVVPHFPSRRA
jgi:hypothetical protein